VVLVTGTCAMLHKTIANAISVYCTAVSAIHNILHCSQCIKHSLLSAAVACESFGVWTPFALSTLSTIADHTTGVSRQLARKQLLQNLSVTLWWYNAKLILRCSMPGKWHRLVELMLLLVFFS